MKPALLAAFATDLVADDPPAEILLIPSGSFEPRPHDGRPAWHNRDPDKVVAATRALQLDLPIDYEHQTAYSRMNGQAAPAAGWIKEVFVRDGEIWGKVEWTARAAAHIQAKEYRHISAVFHYDRNRTVTRLLNAGLTNDPALFMPALASAQIFNTETGDESDMNKDELKKALGLADDATDEQIQAAVTAGATAVTNLAALTAAIGLAEATTGEQLVAAATAMVDTRGDIAEALGLAKTAQPEEILSTAKAKASATAPDATAFVPRAEFDAAVAQLKTLQDTGDEEKATAAVDAEIAAGKITPASRDHFLAMAKANLDDFHAMAKTLPVIVSPDKIVQPGPVDPDTPLNDTEKAVCKAMGITEEKYKESRKRTAEAA